MHPSHITGNAQSAAQIKTRVIEDATSRLESLLSRLDSVNYQALQVGERAFGAYPGKEGNPVPTPVPNGAVATLNDRISQIEECISSLENNVSRINEII